MNGMLGIFFISFYFSGIESNFMLILAMTLSVFMMFNMMLVVTALVFLCWEIYLTSFIYLFI